MTATPTPGALRAAATIYRDPGAILETARVIDAETGVGELLAALEDCLLAVVQLRERSHTGDYHVTVETARAAIARAKGQA